MPPTLHVVIQELCPQEQNIHHAELLATIRAQECFRHDHAIIHVDSASAIATYQGAFDIHGRMLHRHPYPSLCRRICFLGRQD